MACVTGHAWMALPNDDGGGGDLAKAEETKKANSEGQQERRISPTFSIFSLIEKKATKAFYPSAMGSRMDIDESRLCHLYRWW